MVNKNYVNGRRFEYKVKKYLEKMGFLVMRTAGTGILGLYWSSSPAQYVFSNDVLIGSASNATIAFPTTFYYYFGYDTGDIGGNSTLQWIRARAPPPNGVMPSVTFGSFTNTTIYLNNIEDANATITYGTQSNFTAQINNGAYVRLFLNGTQIEPYTKSSVTYLKNLSAGVYKITVQSNTSGVANKTYYETISKATPTPILWINDTKTNNTINYTTMPISINIQTNVINNLTFHQYLDYPNGTIVLYKTFYPSGLVNTSDTFLSKLKINGTYKFYVNVSGNANYTSGQQMMQESLHIPYPIVAVEYSYIFSGEPVSISAKSAFNQSNLMNLVINPAGNLTTILSNTSFTNSESFTISFPHPLNYSINATDKYTGLWTIKYILVSSVTFYQCSATPPPIPPGGQEGEVFNLSVYSEETLQPLQNLSKVQGYLEAENNTRVSNGTYLGYTNASRLKSGKFAICMLAGKGSNILVNGNLFYTNRLNITSSYYFLNTPIDWNSSSSSWVIHSIPLYSVNTTSGIGEFLFATQTNTGQQTNNYVQIYEYLPNTNTYNLVDFIATASQGDTPTILENGQIYSFTALDSTGNTITQLNNQVLSCTSATGCLEIITLNSQVFALNRPTANCKATNTSVTCGVSAGNSGAISYQLQVFTTGPAGTAEYCTQNLTSPNGELICAAPGGGYIWKLTYENAAGLTLYLAGNQNYNTTAGLFGTLGLFLGLMIVIILVFVSSWSPRVSILVLTLGVALFSFVGLFAFNMEFIGGLVIVTMVWLWRFSRGHN